MERDPFKEYILEKEPTKKDLVYSWYTAIGLQKVDILFQDEEINSEAMLVVIDDSERKTQSFYNLILDETITSVCENE